MRKKKIEVKEQDLSLLAIIQPQGGIHFKDDTFAKTGTGYTQCIHVYQLPKSGVNDHWLTTVCNIEGVITTIDVHTEDIFKTKQNINRSIEEQDSRYKNASSFAEKYDAETKFKRMKRLFEELESMDEVMKIVHIRIFVAARSYYELEEKTKTIQNYLDGKGYKNAVFLNEGKEEWCSLFRKMSDQNEYFQIPGVPLTCEVLAAGNPFHFASLEDPYGDYLGETPTKGNVLFDEFTKTTKRLYYNSVAFGKMGTGKSTFLKKRFKARAIRGDFVRTFDISGEFTHLTNVLGGKVIDSFESMLNPLEILKASDESEGLNFKRHMSKLTTFYQLIAEEYDKEEINYFIRALNELYERWNLLVSVKEGKENQITGLPSYKYPCLSDLNNLLLEKIQESINKKGNKNESVLIQHELMIYSKVQSNIHTLITTYGSLFDGHTTMDNITDEQIVTFDISKVKDLQANIFDAYLFNAVSLCWDNCVKNGKTMMDLYKRKKVTYEEIIRFLIIIDESHRWVNAKKPLILDQITVYLREARKYFGGIVLASQSIRDFVPEGSSDKEIEKLKTVFELTQYKFIFRQDSNAIPLIGKVFQDTLTVSLKSKIPKLEMGHCIICIDSVGNLECKIHLTKEEDNIFEGGV